MTRFPHDRTSALADAYQDALIAGRRDEAIKDVMDAVDNGLPIQQLYLEVLQPVQCRIGELWQANSISVAVEHYCTAVTQLLMAQLFPRVMGDGSAQLAMVGCCVSGELHEVGMRMVCDFFEMQNWTTHFLGAGMPEADLVSFVETHSPEVLCISCTTTYNIHRVKRLINAVRSDLGQASPPVLVGGRPFIMAPDLVDQVGADATASDARGAVEAGRSLAA